MTNYVHDCRPELLKFKLRNSLYDVSLLSTLLTKAKNSTNELYECYLHQPEDLKMFESSSYDYSNNNRPIESKVIRDVRVNVDDRVYGNLVWPNSIVSTFSGEVIVADSLENRLLVFNRDFIFKYKIGSKGKQNGQFDQPVDLVLNESGKLCVADKNNYRVQIFNETKKYKEIKVQLVGILSSSRKANESLGVAGGASAGGTNNSTRSNIFKTGSEFSFYRSIKLDDKPVKLSTAPLNCLTAIATENGLIFILNYSNELISYLKMKTPFNPIDLMAFCLNDVGDKLLLFKHFNNEIYIKFYDTKSNSSTNISDDYFLSKYPKETNQLNKMNLVSKYLLEKTYLPGICLSKISLVKLSLDLKHLFIFDEINMNLLEYDMDGRYSRIVLRAEEHLGKLLAFDFSGDRQHIISSEVYLDKRFNLSNSVSILNQTNNSNNNSNLTRFEIEQRNRSRAYSFKLKSYRFKDCECHRSINEKNERNASLINLNFDNDEFSPNISRLNY